MSILKGVRTVGFALMTITAALAPRSARAQASPYRGLWAGSATLQAVNEVSVPLDADNVPVAPDPAVPTPAFDQAHLRLLLHVNGAGQVYLLKQVAILNRKAGDEVASLAANASETDLALVTDPRVYPEFPPQPAVRLASAVFDFGDAYATQALDALVAEAARRAAAYVADPARSVDTPAQQVQVRDDAVASLLPALTQMAAHADVAQSYSQFLDEVVASNFPGRIVLDPEDAIVSNFLARASALQAQAAFYGDTRAGDFVQTVVAAVQEAAPDERQAVAHNIAAAFADVANTAQRFISGKLFGDMMQAAAQAAAPAAQAPDATAASVLAALRATPEATEAIAEALRVKQQSFEDTRAQDAVDAVLAAMASAAFAQAEQTAEFIGLQAEQAGRAELGERVARYPLPPATPTLDYNALVQSAAFGQAAQQAATAAAAAAVEERATDPLFTEVTLRSAALPAAANALDTLYATAARAMRTELFMSGRFGPPAAGAGDEAHLTACIYLPARHPTNPFRHRRHPDHTLGFDVRRVVRLAFDGVEGDALEPAGFGTQRVSGTYREELFGLHKPLGPAPDTAPIGLKVEGRFELRRVSRIDTLNTR
jgi:hypothetical protein